MGQGSQGYDSIGNAVAVDKLSDFSSLVTVADDVKIPSASLHETMIKRLDQKGHPFDRNKTAAIDKVVFPHTRKGRGRHLADLVGVYAVGNIRSFSVAVAFLQLATNILGNGSDTICASKRDSNLEPRESVLLRHFNIRSNERDDQFVADEIFK